MGEHTGGGDRDVGSEVLRGQLSSGCVKSRTSKAGIQSGELGGKEFPHVPKDDRAFGWRSKTPLRISRIVWPPVRGAQLHIAVSIAGYPCTTFQWSCPFHLPALDHGAVDP